MDKYTFYTSEPISSYKVPIFEKERNKDWVRYGEDNAYPQYLCDLFNKSAKHNAILTAKQKYTFGRGLKIVDGKESAQAIKAQDMLLNPNRFETLNDIFEKVALDKRLYGGYALQVNWSKASGKIAELYHMDFAKIRSNVDNTEFYYSENWEDYRPKYAIFKAFNPEKKEGLQILYYREYRPNLSTYPLPDYIGAIPYIESDVEVANFHRANLQNNFFFGGILNFNNGTPEPEEQQELVKRINRRHGSTDNAGRWIINFSDGQDKSPNVIPIQPADLDKQFDILNKTIQQEIFVAHRVTSPIFMGIRVEGQLGGRNEMIDAFRLFQQNEIRPDQVHFEKVFNYLANFNGVPNAYRVEELEPFNPEFTEATLLEIATKDELREMAGLPVTDSTKDSNSKIVDRLTLFSPLISNKILESLSRDEIRGLAGIAATTEPITTPTQLRLQFEDNWKDEIKVFAEFGDSVDNYELFESRRVEAFEDLDEDVRKHTFEEHLEDLEQTLYEFVVPNTPEENKVLEAVKKDPFISKKDLGVNTDLTPSKLDEVLKSLKDKAILTLTEGTWNILQVVPKKSAIKRIADEISKFQVKYRYTGPQDSKNREFCAALLDLNKLYTRKEIDTISRRVNRDVWKRRGGWKTIKGTDIHVPFCRHQWAGVLTRKK
jgi:hypothetical protein